jgi:hypothetical protein
LDRQRLCPEDALHEAGIQPRRQRLPAKREFETSHPGDVVRNRCGSRRHSDLVCDESVRIAASPIVGARIITGLIAD